MGAAGQPLGRYLLGDRLAVGGMGEVYVGVQKGLGDFEKPLAIKLLLPHLAEEPGAIAEFLNEARLASRLSHPHVVQIYDVGQEGGRYYLAMELVRGISLAGLLARLETRGEQLPASLVAFIAHGLLDGLQHAHELKDAQGRTVGLVHRDVSPHNLLLSTSGEVKLADFGIARAQDTKSSTRTGTVRGKPAYLAPEVFDGVPANPGTDLFAATVTIFQLATLRSPFRRETDAATMKAIFTEPLPLLRSLRPDLSPELERALQWGAERDPTRRAPTALALRDAIPVTYGATGARELGALVASLGAATVQQVESGVARTTQLARGTREASVSIAAPMPVAPTSVAQLPARRAPVTALVLGTVALAAMGLAGLALVKLTAKPELTAPQPAPVASRPAEAVAALEPPTVPAPTPAATPSLTPSPAPTPGPVATRPSAAAPARAVRPSGPRIGFLTVDAQPWASVSVRGRAIGDTPLYKFPLDEGDVTVELKNPDTGKSATRRVKVVPGRETSLKVNLQ